MLVANLGLSGGLDFVNLIGENVAPTIDNKGSALTTAIVGEMYSHTVDFSDADNGVGELTLTVSSPLDVSGNVVSYTPASATDISYTIRVTDPSGLFDEEIVSLIVSAANVAPTIVNPGAQDNNINDVISLQIVATDLDGPGVLVFSAVNLPAGLSINAASGLISGTITDAGVVSLSSRVDVTDGQDVSSSSFFWLLNGAEAIMASNHSGWMDFRFF